MGFRSVAALAFVSTLAVAACTTTYSDMMKEEVANRLSVPAHMHKIRIQTDPFAITVFERAYTRGAPATIYIEGDGLDLMDRAKISTNATPDYPLALHLATRDLGDNVIYIARPCQFSALEDVHSTCPPEFFTSKRYGLEVMNAMNDVLDQLKNRHGFTGFELVGYEGGATVAALLAAKRKDVLSLRTVAGILDTSAFDQNTPAGVTLASLNPKDFATDLAALPQHHFYGALDSKITPALSAGFFQTMGRSACVQTSLIEDVNDKDGWANRWPSLLDMPVSCRLSETAQ
jgi:hypothetical protein